MISKKIRQETAKKVATFDLSGKKNGYLVELFKNKDKTVFYLTVAAPGSFKGYHLHKVRSSRYICVKGKMKITLYIEGKKQEYILTSDPPQRLFIPAGIATGLHNIGREEAWLINYPDPAYDPKLQDEQLDFTESELNKK